MLWILMCGLLCGCEDAPAADEIPTADNAAHAQTLVVLIGGFASDPSPRQIEGVAGRREGNSGLYRLRGDLLAQGYQAEYFNWNGTRAGESTQPQPPMSAGIIKFLRERRRDHLDERLVIVGNSWGGHTALEVTAALAEEPALPVELLVLIDPSSVGRAGRPESLPANVTRAVNYYTHNVIIWRGWPDEPRLENIDLGDPASGFLREDGPRYNDTANVTAHIGAEWDEMIHADIRKRIAALCGAAGKQGT